MSYVLIFFKKIVGFKVKGIFITGTDTGVGKTFVLTVIHKILITKKIKCGIMKPISTGIDPKIKVSQDVLFYKKYCSVDDNPELINPVSFKLPLAPYTATKLSKKNINLDKVFSAYENLSQKYDFLIVEGIGGIAVPITKNYFVADLIKNMKLSCIIVSRPFLGTINHTLLTVDYAKRKDIDIKGIIFNSTQKQLKDIAEKTNPNIIKELTGINIIGNIPYYNKVNEKSINEAQKYLKNILKILL